MGKPSYLFTIEGDLPTLNQVINDSKRSWALYYKTKKVYTGLSAFACANAPKLSGRVGLAFVWYVPSKRKDPDNISFAVKYILDGMVKAGMLEDDRFANIGELRHVFKQGPPRVDVFLLENDYL